MLTLGHSPVWSLFGHQRLIDVSVRVLKVACAANHGRLKVAVLIIIVLFFAARVVHLLEKGQNALQRSQTPADGFAETLNIWLQLDLRNVER